MKHVSVRTDLLCFAILVGLFACSKDPCVQSLERMTQCYNELEKREMPDDLKEKYLLECKNKKEDLKACMAKESCKDFYGCSVETITGKSAFPMEDAENDPDVQEALKTCSECIAMVEEQEGLRNELSAMIKAGDTSDEAYKNMNETRTKFSLSQIKTAACLKEWKQRSEEAARKHVDNDLLIRAILSKGADKYCKSIKSVMLDAIY